MDTQYEEALQELRTKTLNDIQVETALKWAGRACAAATYGLWHDAIEYAHEAIEHAALSGKDNLLRDIRAAMKAHGLEI
jgi:hypothetical protein